MFACECRLQQQLYAQIWHWRIEYSHRSALLLIGVFFFISLRHHLECRIRSNKCFCDVSRIYFVILFVHQYGCGINSINSVRRNSCCDFFVILQSALLNQCTVELQKHRSVDICIGRWLWRPPAVFHGSRPIFIFKTTRGFSETKRNLYQN